MQNQNNRELYTVKIFWKRTSSYKLYEMYPMGPFFADFISRTTALGPLWPQLELHSLLNWNTPFSSVLSLLLFEALILVNYDHLTCLASWGIPSPCIDVLVHSPPSLCWPLVGSTEYISSVSCWTSLGYAAVSFKVYKRPKARGLGLQLKRAQLTAD